MLRDAVAQSLEQPSKVPVCYNSTDVGSHHAAALGDRIAISEENLFLRQELSKDFIKNGAKKFNAQRRWIAREKMATKC